MNKTTSQDGTVIAFEHIGHGAPVILVMGAFNDRRTGAGLAAALAAQFRVFSYDRRGRGQSGDASAYAIDRELDDLAAIVGAAGGEAAVFGYSSGAALAVRAAARGLGITKLALYDLPPSQPAEHAAALASLVANGRRGEAVEYFQRRLVGIPEPVIAQLRHAPFRPALEAMAHTLAYDAALMDYGGGLAELLPQVRQPTLAAAAGAGPAFMRTVAQELAASVPKGRFVTIDRATHDLDAELLVPVLAPFLGG